MQNCTTEYALSDGIQVSIHALLVASVTQYFEIISGCYIEYPSDINIGK
jgi:hypothetical protein